MITGAREINLNSVGQAARKANWICQHGQRLLCTKQNFLVVAEDSALLTGPFGSLNQACGDAGEGVYLG